MREAVEKFAHDIVNDVLAQYKICLELPFNKCLVDAPIIYNQRCKQIVKFYCTQYKVSKTKYYAKEGESLNNNTFCYMARKLIFLSSCHHQCSGVFYRLCVQLALLGVFACKEGNLEGLSLAMQEIVPLACKAYLRCDLDDSYDYAFNFSFDILKCVFEWAECEVDFGRELERLDCGHEEFFVACKSSCEVYLHKEARSVMNKFKALNSKLRKLSRETFVCEIQERCDRFYTELVQLRRPELQEIFVEVCMFIALLTLHAYETLHPTDFEFAHERILRLTLSATRYGIIKVESNQ